MKKLLCFALVMLAGCGPTEYAGETVTKLYRISGETAYEFRLEDGTRCVRVSRGGVDCEWKSRP